MTSFAELVAATNFSFLRGASHAREIVGQAAESGLTAIGIADRNTLAGVVRAYGAAKDYKIRRLTGARLVTTESFEAVCYPTDRAAYGRLCRLLTAGNRRALKGQCEFSFDEVVAAAEGQLLIAIPPRQAHAWTSAKLRGTLLLPRRAGLSSPRYLPMTAPRVARSASSACAGPVCTPRWSRPMTPAITTPPQAAAGRARPAFARNARSTTPAIASRPMPSGT